MSARGHDAPPVECGKVWIAANAYGHRPPIDSLDLPRLAQYARPIPPIGQARASRQRKAHGDRHRNRFHPCTDIPSSALRNPMASYIQNVTAAHSTPKGRYPAKPMSGISQSCHP